MTKTIDRVLTIVAILAIYVTCVVMAWKMEAIMAETSKIVSGMRV